MKASTWAWAIGSLGLATSLAFDLLPGNVSDSARYLMIGLLYTIGFLVLAGPFTLWIIRRTTKPEDYEGGCPVGKVCPDCGAFTFAPKQVCRACGLDLNEVDEATRENTEPTTV